MAGEAGSQHSCTHVQAGQRNDCSSGGPKNAVWRDCRIGGRGPKVRGGLGEGDSAGRESRVNLIHKVEGLRRKGEY